MKRSSKYLLTSYIIILVLTSIMPASGGSFWPFYLLICVIALFILLLESQKFTTNLNRSI